MNVKQLRSNLEIAAQRNYNLMIHLTRGNVTDIYTFYNKGNKMFGVHVQADLFNSSKSLDIGNVNDIVQEFERPYKLWNITEVKYF